MNKETFLKELQTRIRVLEASEQQDILAEYAQHIDLQIEGGVSEEEAIRDFGGLDELVAEILEAYHVNPAYLKKPVGFKGVRTISLPDPRPALRRGASAVAGFFRRMGGGIKRFFRVSHLRLKTLFRRRSRAEKQKQHKEERPHMERTPLLTPALSTVKGAGGACAHLIRALARLIWNLALLLVSLPLLAMSAGCLLAMGVLLVLLVQGYPLAGATLCCLGGAMCCGALLVLCGSLVSRRRRAADPTETEAPTAIVAETSNAIATASVAIETEISNVIATEISTILVEEELEVPHEK